MIIVKNIEYTKEEFELICIKYNTRAGIAKFLGCSPNTLTSSIRKYMPELQQGFSSKVSLGMRVLRLKGLKSCSSCTEVKRMEDFNVDTHTSDGRKGKCRSCTKKEGKQFYSENKSSYYFWKAKRRAAQLQRTPKWADLEKIKEIYSNCPEGYEVDHIIPLQGKTVSGLHVAENLQYLTPIENRSKSNKYKDE